MEIVITVPFCGDEIISCFSILKNKSVNIVYTNDSNENALSLKEYFDIRGQFFNKSIPPIFLNNKSIIFVPDHIFEYRPEYRMLGLEGERLLRNGLNIVFYSTSVNAPFIYRVCNSDQKRDTLNKVYPDRKYDDSYLNFEGYYTWIMDVKKWLGNLSP